MVRIKIRQELGRALAGMARELRITPRFWSAGWPS
jgi:hypothetical protein